ncbi:DUF2815 family protein [Thomasclavelia cocleata]|jgi:hypothetical protein|uniref:DUF2815 family protein n=2 Tax=Thomasclavelia cocleata TaxID=69824 RepID=UPI00249526F1|nr:DUF2815 family protein [Thomasclavelia cocleata]
MSKRIKLNNVRLSYVNVFEARAMNEGQEPKYSTQIIISKDHPQIKELKKAVIEVAKDKFPKLVKDNKIPAKIKTPLRDGDEERDDEPEVYGGMYFFNASNKKRPTVVDRDKTPLTEDDNVIYSGCYANVFVDIYGFDTAGNKGVAAALGGVQFKKDGEALGGKGVTADDFDVEEDDEDDYDI